MDDPGTDLEPPTRATGRSTRDEPADNLKANEPDQFRQPCRKDTAREGLQVAAAKACEWLEIHWPESAHLRDSTISPAWVRGSPDGRPAASGAAKGKAHPLRAGPRHRDRCRG